MKLSTLITTGAMVFVGSLIGILCFALTFRAANTYAIWMAMYPLVDDAVYQAINVADQEISELQRPELAANDTFGVLVDSDPGLAKILLGVNHGGSSAHSSNSGWFGQTIAVWEIRLGVPKADTDFSRFPISSDRLVANIVVTFQRDSFLKDPSVKISTTPAQWNHVVLREIEGELEQRGIGYIAPGATGSASASGE